MPSAARRTRTVKPRTTVKKIPARNGATSVTPVQELSHELKEVVYKFIKRQMVAGRMKDFFIPVVSASIRELNIRHWSIALQGMSEAEISAYLYREGVALSEGVIQRQREK